MARAKHGVGRDSAFRLSVRAQYCRWVAAAVCLLFPLPSQAQNADVVMMENGTFFVGEVKGLRQGLLEISVNDVVNRLRIEWLHVTRVTSPQQHDIALRDGAHYLGSLIEASEAGQLRIRTADAVVDVAMADVVFIEPIRDSFWDRVEGSVSTGLSASKSTDLVLLNLGIEARYRTTRTVSNVSLSSFSSYESGRDVKTSSELQLNRFRILGRRWLSQATVAASRNDELGINLRAGVGGGGGRAVIASNHVNLWLSGLLSGNREYTNDGQQQYNLELVFATKFMAFRYDSPKLEVKANLYNFASLTTAGRYRLNIDGRISLELLKDFFWDISQIYYQYDNDPSTTAQSTSDYGIVTGVRYKF